MTAGDRERFEAIAGRLDWLAAVPDEVLAGVVTRDGLCFGVSSGRCAGDDRPGHR
jgi:hypothetical protein